jgi:hypothetical protein
MSAELSAEAGRRRRGRIALLLVVLLLGCLLLYGLALVKMSGA